MTSELKEGARALHSLWNVRLSKHRNIQNAVLKLNETYNNPIGIQNTWKFILWPLNTTQKYMNSKRDRHKEKLPWGLILH